MDNEYNKKLERYEYEDDDSKREKLKEELVKEYGTNKKCPKCGDILLKSDLKEYSYLCLECNENFYSMEVM